MAEFGPARWTGGKKQVKANDPDASWTDEVPSGPDASWTDKAPTATELGADAGYAPAVDEPDTGVTVEADAQVELVPEPDPQPEPDATDAAKAFAAKHNIDLATVVGTGTGGRITRDDVAALVTDESA